MLEPFRQKGNIADRELVPKRGGAGVVKNRAPLATQSCSLITTCCVALGRIESCIRILLGTRQRFLGDRCRNAFLRCGKQDIIAWGYAYADSGVLRELQYHIQQQSTE